MLKLICFLLFPVFAFALPSEYKSPADELITVQKISVLPVADNLDGIYSRPVEEVLNEEIDKNHHWQLIPINAVGPIYSPEELEYDPMQVKKIAGSTNTDALIATKVTKGPSGISINMSMFLKQDGKLLFQEKRSKISAFEVRTIERIASEMLNLLLQRMPYSGLILSRQGPRVTLNLGTEDGIKINQVVNIAQVIELERHPKFHFLVGTKKQTLGKVKLLKVDKSLSFGAIITEIEETAIQPGAKVIGFKPVQYSEAESGLLGKQNTKGLHTRPDHKMSFGEKAIAWLPKRTPTFGRVGLHIGGSTFTGKLSQSTPLEADSSLYPVLAFDGEIWVTPKWSVHAKVKQGILSADNPSSSGPNDLSMSLSSYDFSLGYNFRLSQEVWGPQVILKVGSTNYKLYVDDVPNGLTTLSYSGIKIGLSGSAPVTPDQQWSVGADFYWVINPQLTETPGTSGNSADNSVSLFGINVGKKLGVNLQAIGKFNLEMYSTNFSGTGTRSTPATSASQRHASVTAGLNYFF
ncbi:MAG: porin family protein [Bdellovibrionales bacterium]|nr:porin family protein [Bdellovibrionales bacterium]